MTKRVSIGRILFLVFSFLVMWGIFAGNFFNEDYIHYENEFEAGSLDRLEELHIEPLYTYSIYYLKQLFGFKDYVQYKALIAFIFMIPYWYTINRWSSKPALTLLFWAPIFLLQVVIVRNFMAFSIMTLAIPLLVVPKKRNLILFFVLILVAEGFHNMMFVYLLCYLTVKDFKFLKTPISYFILCLIVAIIFSGFLLTMYMSSSAKYSFAEDDGYNYLRMVMGIPLLVNYYVLNYIKNNTRESKNVEVADFEKFILKLNLVFIGLTVLFSVSMVASRLFINLLLFNMIFVANRVLRGSINGKGIICSFLYVAFWIYYVLVISLSIQLEEIFKYNYFIIYLFS